MRGGSNLITVPPCHTHTHLAPAYIPQTGYTEALLFSLLEGDTEQGEATQEANMVQHSIGLTISLALYCVVLNDTKNITSMRHSMVGFCIAGFIGSCTVWFCLLSIGATQRDVAQEDMTRCEL